MERRKREKVKRRILWERWISLEKTEPSLPPPLPSHGCVCQGAGLGLPVLPPPAQWRRLHESTWTCSLRVHQSKACGVSWGNVSYDAAGGDLSLIQGSLLYKGSWLQQEKTKTYYQISRGWGRSHWPGKELYYQGQETELAVTLSAQRQSSPGSEGKTPPSHVQTLLPRTSRFPHPHLCPFRQRVREH